MPTNILWKKFSKISPLNFILFINAYREIPEKLEQLFPKMMILMGPYHYPTKIDNMQIMIILSIAVKVENSKAIPFFSF